MKRHTLKSPQRKSRSTNEHQPQATSLDLRNCPTCLGASSPSSGTIKMLHVFKGTCSQRELLLRMNSKEWLRLS